MSHTATMLVVPDPDTSESIPPQIQSIQESQIAADDIYSLCRSDVWREIVRETFGHQPAFISISHNGSIADTIPFFLVRTFLGERKMISPPYQGFDGGFTAIDPAVRRHLINQILQQARQYKVRYVEIRSLTRTPELTEIGFIETTPFLVSEVPLEIEETNWTKLAASHRRNVRMAEKKGVTIETSTNWEEMKIFHRQLAKHYKDLGIPFFGLEFFEKIWHRLVMTNQGELLVARYDGEIIGGLLMLHSGKTLIVKYSVTRHEEKFAHVNAAYALYWEAIRQGVAMGFKKLNMGITGEHNQGLREFKLRFGADEKQAYFYYYPLKGSIPDYKKLYGSYRFLKQGWKMMPMGVASFLGDLINRWIC